MTETAFQTVDRSAAPVTIRPYRPLDHRACRELWAELAEAHREIYQDPAVGGADPGAGFEEYLTRLDLAGVWVAEHERAGVVGLIGLVLGGATVGGALARPGSQPAGEVEPVVVTARLRGRGIGHELLEYVAAQARKRGMRQLSISPASRNVDAIRCLHAAGYDTLASVTLTMALVGGTDTGTAGLDLHGLDFLY
ncbi:MAG TPA: GNAT family N-acetyltransferase [Rugosimonospora sp.]|nr:GNAT family N-acetyltransferase [Rugosimonospora sp.]